MASGFSPSPPPLRGWWWRGDQNHSLGYLAQRCLSPTWVLAKGSGPLGRYAAGTRVQGSSWEEEGPLSEMPGAQMRK